MTRIFPWPDLSIIFAMFRDFSTIWRTLPGLQYMISRISSMVLLLACVDRTRPLGRNPSSDGRRRQPLLARHACRSRLAGRCERVLASNTSMTSRRLALALALLLAAPIASRAEE